MANYFDSNGECLYMNLLLTCAEAVKAPPIGNLGAEIKSVIFINP